MENGSRLASAAIAVALVIGLVVPATIARADLLDNLLDQSGGTGPTKLQKAAKKSTSTDTTATAGATATGPAVIPAATPLIVKEYSTDPAQLQGGSRFELSLTVNNPGGDDAEDVVVQIGPSSETNWGSNAELVALGSGSAQYVGTIASGASSSDVTFDLMANPASVGGLRSVAVKTTWKSNGYEHTSSEVVGLLVNSCVTFDSSLQTTGAPVQKVPFGTALRLKNTTTRTVKGVFVVFSGDGARASTTTSVTVGDIGPGETRTVPMNYTAPLVGRAKISAKVSYFDDFGEQRAFSVNGWARVQRVAPAPEERDVSVPERVMAYIAALLGLGN